MPWSVVKKRLWLEKKRLAEQFLEETEANLKNLSETKLLVSKSYDMAVGADQLQLFPEDFGRQMARAYEKVATINDALVKYQKYRSSAVSDPDFDKKCSEFQQFLVWYRGGLAATLESLRARLNEEMKEPPEQEMMTR